MAAPERARAGLTSDGSPSRLNKLRTMRNSLARRIALRRPRTAEMKEIEDEIERLKSDFILEGGDRMAKLQLPLKKSAAFDELRRAFHEYARTPMTNSGLLVAASKIFKRYDL